MPFLLTKLRQNKMDIQREACLSGCAALFHGEGWRLPINTPGVTIRG